jgi:kumamolisin
LSQLYQLPPADGAGECIALIELGGGYNDSDLQSYFQQLGVKMPQVASVSVDGATNSPSGDPASADGEVELDIEVAGGIAPGARIVVYFAPNTDQGFLDAITHAIHDTTNKPTIMSISWGGPESSWTAQATQAMDMAFQSAASIGMTIFVASGDSGADDGVGDGSAHVDFPASSPHVVACGGTSLPGPSIASEVVWNDPTGGATGGGVSDLFDLPSWQSAAGVPPSVNANRRVGRGVPDVAGDADPATGYTVIVDGSQQTIGGTSAVAPLWAGLFALINAQLAHPVGYANPLLYQQLAYPTSGAASAFHDITSGNNGANGAPGYSAGENWDACTGLGSPVGNALLASLKSLIGAKAGVPVGAPAQGTTPKSQ